jgi:hypothetical protein
VKDVTPSHPLELSCSPTTAAAGLALPPACGDERDLAGLTIMDPAKLLRSKSASPVPEAHENYNHQLYAFITVFRKRKLALRLTYGLTRYAPYATSNIKQQNSSGTR